MRYVYARESKEVEASSERAAFAPERDSEGRYVASVELSPARQNGHRQQVRERGHQPRLGGSFQLGSDVDLMQAAVGEVLLQTVGEQAQASRTTWQHNMPGVTEQNASFISFSIIRSEDLMLTRLCEVHSVFSTEVVPRFIVSVSINYALETQQAFTRVKNIPNVWALL